MKRRHSVLLINKFPEKNTDTRYKQIPWVSLTGLHRSQQK